jgi:hypothetical protein
LSFPHQNQPIRNVYVRKAAQLLGLVRVAAGERKEGVVLHFEEDLLLGNVYRARGRDWGWV